MNSFEKNRFFILCACLIFGTGFWAQGQVVINEVSGCNTGQMDDENGQYEDWIELYNTSDVAYDLSHHFLSDDMDNPYKWLVPEGVEIDAGEFLVVWASAGDAVLANGELHTNFKIDVTGEPVLLTNPQGEMMDFFPAITHAAGHSFGRFPDGSGNYRFFKEPTPVSSNNAAEAFEQYLSSPLLLTPPGEYNQPFSLFIDQSNPGATLHYTLDGSHPNSNSPELTDAVELYDRQNEPDNISAIPTTPSTVPEWYRWYPPMDTVYKGTTLRVRAIKEDAISSPVTTGFYMVDEEIENRYDLPVVSLTTPENYLFGGWGIFTNYNLRGPNWERLAHMAYYEPNGNLAFSTNVGLRVHGNNSRRYALKSMRIYFRERYGLETAQYDLFPGSGILNHERLLLRHSGSDWRRTYFRDAFAQQVLNNYCDVDFQHYQPVITFLNSEYWGVMNLRERLDDNYIKLRYAYKRDEIDMLVDKETVVYGNSAHYFSLRDYWEENDLDHPEHYDYVKTQMDVVDFRDYHILQIYSMNTDQPGKNVRFWRPKEPGGKWRWMLLDMDDSFAYAPHCDYDRNGLVFCVGLDSISAPNVNPKSNWPTWAPNSPARTLPLRSLLSNTEFRHDFILRFADMLNTAFLPERMNELVDITEDRISDYMYEHYRRWHRPEPDFRDEHVELVRTFVNHRKAVMEEDIVSFFELSGKYDLTVQVQPEGAGHVKVNSILIHPDSVYIQNSEIYPWSGTYYADLEFPIVARVAHGYVFSHWLETGETPDTLWISSSENLTRTAVFEAVPVHEPIHYWSFNNENDPTLADYTIGGAALWPPDPEITVSASSSLGFDGSNARFETPVGAHWVINNPAGSEIVLELPTSGYHSPVLTYEIRKTTQGAGLHRVLLSTDGENFTLVDSAVVYNGNPEMMKVDFAPLLGTADNPQLKVKIEMKIGEGGSIGTNRIDNLALDAIPIIDGNLPPGLAAPLFRLNLIAGQPPTAFNLSEMVTDPNGDTVNFVLHAEQGSSAQASLSAGTLNITPMETGSFLTTIAMDDGFNQPTKFDVEVLVHPAPAVISDDEGFAFTEWATDQPEATFPAHMLFVQGQTADPGLNTPLAFAYDIPAEDYHFDDITTVGHPYNNQSRTRINGLDEQGISFINTGTTRDVGGAIVAIQTTGIFEPVFLTFTAGTRMPHSRVYNIRLQYRLGLEESFQDIIIDDEPIEYEWNPVGNQMETFEEIELPEVFLNQPYAQLVWRYYYTGNQVLFTTGKRAELRLDDIFIGTEGTITNLAVASGNLVEIFPNPASDLLNIRTGYTELLTAKLYALNGQLMLMNTGFVGHGYMDVKALSPGMYIMVLHRASGEVYERKKVLVVR